MMISSKGDGDDDPEQPPIGKNNQNEPVINPLAVPSNRVAANLTPPRSSNQQYHHQLSSPAGGTAIPTPLPRISQLPNTPPRGQVWARARHKRSVVRYQTYQKVLLWLVVMALLLLLQSNLRWMLEFYESAGQRHLEDVLLLWLWRRGNPAATTTTTTSTKHGNDNDNNKDDHETDFHGNLGNEATRTRTTVLAKTWKD